MTAVNDSVLSAINDLFVSFVSDTRLYEFTLWDSDDLAPWLDNRGLLVAAFSSQDRLHQIPHADILAIARRIDLPTEKLVGRTATLYISQADGSRTSINGLISQAACLSSDGGLARYQLRLASWLELLTLSTQCRVWQEQPINQIIDGILSDYTPHAHWQWSDDATQLLAQLPPRSYCVQYRETPLDFISRLLAEDGLSWRMDLNNPDAHDGHSLVIFADSTQTSACPDNLDNGAIGLRYSGSGSQQQTDSITRLSMACSLQPSQVTLASFDYKAKSITTASVPSTLKSGGRHYSQLPPVEHYDHPGQYAFTDSDHAERHASLRIQAHEIRYQYWQGQGTIRSLRAGQRFTIDGNPRSGDGTPGAYVTSSVTMLGINNLASTAAKNSAQALGSIADWLAGTLDKHRESISEQDPLTAFPGHMDQLIQTVKRLGYVNTFTAIDAARPWRAMQTQRLNAKPSVWGSQTAHVVGFETSDDISNDQTGNEEICCDKLGRVRVRFQWQDELDSADSRASCWVRVAQRSAVGGMGSQFLPRIGQEVQVQFIEGDIDRPLIIGAHYNGQGQGGVISTPDGQIAASDTSGFAQASDHSATNQGNLTSGNAPVWHGASPDPAEHNNAAAQWGIRSKEFNGYGYNQLVFDDSDSQGRIQLKTTQSGSELNLGHLIHTADNYRGSYRGKGIELRSDAWGALRAGSGWFITSYGINHSQSQRAPVAHSPASWGLLKTADTLSATLSQLAQSHLTVALAAQVGSIKTNASTLDKENAPLHALANVTQGMVSSKSPDMAYQDAAGKNTQTGTDKVPHHTDPIISIIAKDDLAMTAGQNLQFNSTETLNFINGGDSQTITGGQWRIHAGQAIGITTGGLKKNATAGLQLITAKGDTTIQAHSDQISLKARDALTIQSAQAHIDFAAAKSVTLRTAGGASITITGGNITTQCPGKITINAGQKSFTGGSSQAYDLPLMPEGELTLKNDSPFSS